MKRQVIRYRGDVQGVGFRVTAIQEAQGLSIVGFVRNEPNGDVLMDVQGTVQDVKELRRRLESTMALKINEVLVDDREPLPDAQPPRSNKPSFVIRY